MLLNRVCYLTTSVIVSDWESKFLNLQVMQQGTLANLCKSAACRLFIMLPFRSHFVREKSGERDGGEPGRGGGKGGGEGGVEEGKR